MARIPDLLIRDMKPPAHDDIPRGAWLDVVRRLGDLVIVFPVTSRNEAGELKIECALNQETIAKVKAVLTEHCDWPWELDADWWKHQ